jgi:hypothetical protein
MNNVTKVELTVDELDKVNGGADVLTSFLVGFAKGLSEPLPSQPKPTPAPPSGGGGGGGNFLMSGGMIGGGYLY